MLLAASCDARGLGRSYGRERRVAPVARSKGGTDDAGTNGLTAGTGAGRAGDSRRQYADLAHAPPERIGGVGEGKSA